MTTIHDTDDGCEMCPFFCFPEDYMSSAAADCRGSNGWRDVDGQ